LAKGSGRRISMTRFGLAPGLAGATGSFGASWQSRQSLFGTTAGAGADADATTGADIGAGSAARAASPNNKVRAGTERKKRKPRAANGRGRITERQNGMGDARMIRKATAIKMLIRSRN
jgi:hypothetical protein